MTDAIPSSYVEAIEAMMCALAEWVDSHRDGLFAVKLPDASTVVIASLRPLIPEIACNVFTQGALRVMCDAAEAHGGATVFMLTICVDLLPCVFGGFGLVNASGGDA